MPPSWRSHPKRTQCRQSKLAVRLLLRSILDHKAGQHVRSSAGRLVGILLTVAARQQ